MAPIAVGMDAATIPIPVYKRPFSAVKSATTQPINVTPEPTKTKAIEPMVSPIPLAADDFVGTVN